MAYRALVGCLVAVLSAACVTAQAQQFIITERPELPRGGIGTFQHRWASRIEKPPADGTASFYTDKLTATGERLRPYDRQTFTCSHPKPSELGQRYIVRRGDKAIRCIVNDIGPAKHLNRAIDLTPAGFEALGMSLNDGLGPVTIERE